MASLRGTRLLVALTLAVGLGAAAAPAAGEPTLSPGCATLHAMEPDQQLSSDHVQVTAATYAAGEILRVESVADEMGMGPFVTISSPGRPDAYLPGTVGQVMTYAFPADGTYTLDIVSRYQPAVTTVKLGCGLPPAPVATVPTRDLYVGEHADISVSCEPGTNPLETCTDSYGTLDPACREAGCVRTLDTSIQGDYLFQVTGVDSRGLQRTRQFWYQVVRRPQSIEFTSTPPDHATYGGAAYDVSAVAVPSGLTPVVFTSGMPRVCQVSGSTVTFVGVGTCLVRASQAGDNTYEAARVVTQSFDVGRAGTTIDPSAASKGVLGLTATTFTATLVRSDSPAGVPRVLAGETLTFVVGGKTMCSATTDIHGVATCSAPIGLVSALTQKTYTATFAGSGVYEPSSSTGTLG
jgi:hypothetical protein